MGVSFAVSNQGNLYCLGEQPNSKAAIQAAYEIKAPIILVIDQAHARAWFDLLDRELPYTPEEEAEALLLDRIKKGQFIYEEPTEDAS